MNEHVFRFSPTGSKGTSPLLSIIRSVGIVTVSGTGMIGSPGAAVKVFTALGSSNVNVMMISQGSSEATISCVVARKDVDNAVRTLQLALLGQASLTKLSLRKTPAS